MNFLNKKRKMIVSIRRFSMLSILFILLKSSGCNDVKEIEYKGIKDTQLETLNLNNAAIRIYAEFFNPNNFGVDVKETNLSIYLNDKFISYAEQPSKTQIPKNSSFIFPITAHFDPLKALGFAFKNILSKSVKITVQGSAKVGKSGMYIRVPVNISDNVPITF